MIMAFLHLSGPYLFVFFWKCFVLPSILLFLSKTLWDIYINCMRDKNCSLPLPPGSFGIPFLGETINFIKKNVNFYKELHSKLGNIVKTHVFGSPTIRVQGAANVRKIFLGEHTLVSPYWPKSVRLILGEHSISQSHGDIHRRRRKIISKAFNNEALRSYIPQIQDVVAEKVTRWCEENKEIPMYDAFKELIFEISSIVLLGFKYSDKEIENFSQHFHQITSNLFSFPVNLPGTGLNKALKSKNILMKAIEKTLKLLKDSDHNDKSAMNYILEELDLTNGEKLSSDELKALAFDFLFNGYDTTSSAAFVLSYHLAHNPEIQNSIREELLQHGLMDTFSDSRLNMESLNQLKYTKNVIKEALRIIPPVPGAYRKVLQTFELDGYQIPQGWLLGYSIRGTHEISELYADGDKFDPERWISIDKKDGSADKQSRFNYIPFGGGSRQCLGKEFSKLVLTILLIEMVRRFLWKPVKPFTEINMLTTPRPKDGFPVYLTTHVDLNMNVISSS